MKNLDNVKNLETVRAELFASMQNENEEEMRTAFTNYCKTIEEEIKNQAKTYNDSSIDERTLIDRGVIKALTTDERKYFNAVIEKKGFEGIEGVFPKTIFDDVFKNLKEKHPLLSRVDFKNTNGILEFITAKPNVAKAFWGTITDDIKQIILKGFEVVDIKASKLSGFVPVSKSYFELGPNWLAKYVTEVIYEIMSASLELAIVQGDGKNQPIGMMKKLSGALDGSYPDKDKVTIANFQPKTLAGIRGAMAKGKTDSSNVCIVVNPITYWSKMFGNLANIISDGTWVYDRLATGEEIIKSYAVPEDTLIFGDLKNYLLGVAGATRIDKYEQTLAIEDMDLYVAKMFGHGVAKDANAFFVADISMMDGATIAPLEVKAGV